MGADMDPVLTGTENSAIPTTEDIRSTGEIVRAMEDAEAHCVFQCRGIFTGTKYYAIAHRKVEVGEHLWRPWNL